MSLDFYLNKIYIKSNNFGTTWYYPSNYKTKNTTHLTSFLYYLYFISKVICFKSRFSCSVLFSAQQWLCTRILGQIFHFRSTSEIGSNALSGNVFLPCKFMNSVIVQWFIKCCKKVDTSYDNTTDLQEKRRLAVSRRKEFAWRKKYWFCRKLVTNSCSHTMNWQFALLKQFDWNNLFCCSWYGQPLN